MTVKSLVIAPHPDDETLGCGGTLLRRRAEGAELAWLIVTGISVAAGWPEALVRKREGEIAHVARLYEFEQVYNLGLPTTQLAKTCMDELVAQFSEVFRAFQPTEVFLPHRADVHTDHQLVFDVTAACTKWFRYPSVTRVMAYETISETEFGLNPDCTFCPNSFVDITDFLGRKLDIMTVYESELGVFPFPRSVEAISALARLRGAASGFKAAEAFQLLRERQ